MQMPTNDVKAMVHEKLNAARVNNLSDQLLEVLHRHFFARDHDSQSVVFEQLNALAFAVACLLSGTHNDPAALEFFDKALSANVENPDLHKLYNEAVKDCTN